MSIIYPDFFKLCNEWTDFFYENKMEHILKTLSVHFCSSIKSFYPDKEDIFKSFYLTPYKKVSVVFVGKEPYRNGSATGICFDVKRGHVFDPHLQSIYKELEEEGYYPTKDGNLEYWGKQGILMLNLALTIEKHNSHIELWSIFIKKVFEFLNLKDDIIWVLNDDELYDQCKEWITNNTHHTLKCHLNKSNLFRTINKLLKDKEKSMISW